MKPTKPRTSSRISSQTGITDPHQCSAKTPPASEDVDGVLYALASPTSRQRGEADFVPPDGQDDLLRIVKAGSGGSGRFRGNSCGRRTFIPQLSRGGSYEKDTGCSGDSCGRRRRGGNHTGAG